MSELIYGRHAVTSVLAAGKRRSTKLFLLHEKGCEDLLALAKAKKVAYQNVPPSFFEKKLPRNVVHQGVLLETEAYPYVSFSALFSGPLEKPCTLLLLDELQDPQNLGALVRSAYLMGAHGVVLTSNRGSIVGEGCVKASSGATEYLPIAQVSSLANSFEILKKNGFWIYGTDPKADKDLGDEEFPPRVALVMGAEGKGMKSLVRQRCDILLKIPIKTGGNIDSLNASAAGAICLYEVLRQRVKKKSHSP